MVLDSGQQGVLTVPEAAEALRVSYRACLGLIRAGQLPARRLGRSYRIRREALDVALAPSVLYGQDEGPGQAGAR